MRESEWGYFYKKNPHTIKHNHLSLTKSFQLLSFTVKMISGHVVCVILEGDILPTALACSWRLRDSGVRREIREKEKIRDHRSLYVSGKLPTYPSPKPSLCLK